MGAALALALTFFAATVTSTGGVVPVSVLSALLSLGFVLRFIGATVAIRQGQWGMSWGWRTSSWGAWGLAAGLLGAAGALLTVAAFGAFVVIDAIGGFVKREEKAPAVKPPRPKRNLWTTLAVVGYLAFVAAFHVFAGQYFPYGVLVSWSLLSLGFCLFLLVALRGPKGTEAHLMPPASHKRHERREERVADPQRARAEGVLVAFRARGDAGPFLDLVREAARAADLPDADMRALETRIQGAFARAGTGRDADIRAALDEVERLLALRSTPLEARP